MKKQFVECGKIVSTHGIKGELKAQVWTNDPNYLLEFVRFFLNNGKQELKIKSSRIHKNMLLFTIDGVTSIEDASEYRGKTIYINRQDDKDSRPFLQDFYGVEVFDIDSNQSYGEIVDIIVTGANDVYILKDSKNVQRLVPDIPHVVLETDINNQIMKIRPLKGLFEDED